MEVYAQHMLLHEMNILISIVGKLHTLMNTFACKEIQRYNMPPFVTIYKEYQRDKNRGKVNMMVIVMALDFHSSCLRRGNDIIRIKLNL